MLITAAGMLAGCAARRDLPYSVNDQQGVIASDALHANGARWDWRSVALMTEKSSADQRARWGLLGYLAQAYETSVKPVVPCRDLRLLAIDVRPLDPVRFTRIDGLQVQRKPTSFSEIWTVAACGHSYRWQVLDYSGDLIAFLTP